MAKQFSRVLATGLLATGLVLSAVAISGASGPRERTIHCRSSTYRVEGHRYTPSHMVFALNGHPSCSDARASIRTWLGSHRDHISDFNFIGWLQGGKLLLSGSRIPTHPPLARFGRGSARCAAHQLSISLGPYGAGAGHIGVPIRFQNEGRTCSLRGYPGVDGLSANGRVVVHAGHSLSGYLGGAGRVATITLAAGQTASAFLEGANFPIQGRPCHPYRTLRISAPDATHSVQLSARYSFCYPVIHPVVAGRTGTRR
jgi:hypothetical protein